MVVSIFSEATVSTSLTLGDVPTARTGPSLTLVGDSVYMYGGRFMDTHSASNDLFIFDLATLVWERVQCEGPLPSPRFLHSATAWGDNHLIICGGGTSAGLDIEPLNDICIFDIRSHRWTIYEFGLDVLLPRYAHLVCLVDHQLHIIGGQSEERRYVMDQVVFDLNQRQLVKVIDLNLQLGSHYCAAADDDILYTSKGKIIDRQLLSVSSNLQGTSFVGDKVPPSFRFPDVHRLGSSLVVSGCFTMNNLQAYGVWALNTKTMEWRPIDTGSCLARGSWNRGVLHPATNRYVIFGHRERDLPSDYQFRRINFTHISSISLEAFAIYRNPKTCTNNDFVDLGLVLMYEPRFSNFSLLTEDGYRIHANLGILRKRWPAIDDFMRCQGENGTLRLQESYHVSMVFVRFLYTNSLDFEEAQSIDVLGSLLGFGRSYSCASLTDLAAFHLHSLLSIASAPLIYRYASSAGRDGLRLRCLALMISERNRLAHDRIFWKQYPKALRNEIISFMPPNFKSPYHIIESEPEPIQNDNYNLHFLPTPDRSTLDAISPPKSPEPIFGDSKPRKFRTASSFLKFNTKRPSLASFFSFSSNSPPPPLMDPEIDPKLSRALTSYGIGTH